MSIQDDNNIEKLIKEIKEYCKEQNLFQGKPKSLNLLETVSGRILEHHHLTKEDKK